MRIPTASWLPTMYVRVCKEVLRNCPWNRAIQLGLGEGPIEKWDQCPNPVGIIGPASRRLAYTYALSAFSVANFNLGS